MNDKTITTVKPPADIDSAAVGTEYSEASNDAPALPSDLHRIMEMAKLMQTQDDQLAVALTRVNEAKLALQRTRRDDLPALMQEYGLKQVRLLDGTTVELKDNVETSISEEHRPAAHAWLALKNYDGIIKTAVIMLFERNERQRATIIAEECTRQFDRNVDVSETIHPQTLKAFVRERLQAKEEIPYDLFGIYPFIEAKLTQPKK